MPTKLIWGENCIVNNAELLRPFGDTALIVTGRSSAKNGALADMKAAFDALGIKYSVFGGVEENPSVECVERAALEGRGCAFVAAIGGGSPLDAGKAAAVLLANSGMKGYDLYEKGSYSVLPVITVPTTAGTGAELTPNFVLTNHRMKTKASAVPRIFPSIAFLDGRYIKDMPYDIMAGTVIDSLAHSIESYMSASSNFMSMRVCEAAFEAFAKIKDALITKNFTPQILDELLLISAMGGIAITQAQTTLPHFLSYALTYNKNIPHGMASGLLLYEYMACFENKDNKNKIEVIVSKLDFGSLKEFGAYIGSLLSINANVSDEELRQYAHQAASVPEKLSRHPEPVTAELLERIYVNSVNRYSKYNSGVKRHERPL